jgi:hypothetical protein
LQRNQNLEPVTHMSTLNMSNPPERFSVPLSTDAGNYTIGSAAESVTISAEAPLLKTETAEQSTVITEGCRRRRALLKRPAGKRLPPPRTAHEPFQSSYSRASKTLTSYRAIAGSAVTNASPSTCA